MKEFEIANALHGASFHGETWVKCPYCGKAYEISAWFPKEEKHGYSIYECTCGKLFKVR